MSQYAEYSEITAPDGEKLQLEKRGPLATFSQVATLLGFHRVNKITGAKLDGRDAHAQASIVRTGMDSWTLQSKGTPGYEGGVKEGLRLTEVLLRLHRLEKRYWKDKAADGTRVFHNARSTNSLDDHTQGVDQMAQRIGLLLPN